MPQPLLIYKEHSSRLNTEFAEYLDGKSVAIVGRANLDFFRQAAKIDSYDVVVRIHDPIPFTKLPDAPTKTEGWAEFVDPYWQSRIGKKANIWYTNVMGGADHWLTRVVGSFKAAGGQFICCEREANCWHPNTSNMWKFMPVRYLTLDHIVHVGKLINSKPMSGALIVCDILRHKVSNVYLTGFPNWIRDDGSIENKAELDHHRWQPWRDFNFFKSLAQHPRVEVDLHMQDLYSKYGKWVESVPNTDSPIQAGIIDL